MAGRPLSILFTVHGYPPDTWAGTEVYTRELAHALAGRGHAVAVVARTPPADGEADWSVREERDGDVRVFRVARGVEGLPLRECYRPAGARAVLEGLLDRFPADVVHFQHLLHLSVEWVDAARERGLATVYTANDYWGLCARVQLQRPDGVICPENQGMGCLVCTKDKPPRFVPAARVLLPPLDPLVRLAGGVAPAGSRVARFARSWADLRDRHAFVLDRLGAVDLTLAPSRFLRDRLLATGRFAPERVVHSDYGMRPAREAPATPAREGGPLRLGFIGSLVAYKGIEVLLRAMRELRDEPVELSVLGDFRPDEDAYHAELGRLAEGARVAFRGRFDNARLAEVFAELDALVVPSTWYENSPLVIHEAFLHGTPVVTSDAGGMAELVRDGLDGLHFRLGDSAALAAVLRGLARDPARLAELSRDLPSCKTLEEDAADLERRYRELLAARAS